MTYICQAAKKELRSYFYVIIQQQERNLQKA